MIIDFHTHDFPDGIASRAVQKLEHLSHSHPFTNGSGTDLLRSMKDAGVDVSVILPVATKPQQVKDINDGATALNKKQGGKCRLLSFGAIHPGLEDWERELERIARAGLKGVKIHPPYQQTNLDDPRYLRIIRRADELGLITVTHAGYDIGLPQEKRCSPEMARNVFDKLGDVKLVLAHMGGWRMWKEADRLLADTPALLDTSFSTGSIVPLEGDAYYTPEELPMLSPEEFLHMVRHFGADRVLFGTDSPWSGQAESIAWIHSLPLEDWEENAIMNGNAQRLLRWE